MEDPEQKGPDLPLLSERIATVGIAEYSHAYIWDES